MRSRHSSFLQCRWRSSLVSHIHMPAMGGKYGDTYQLQPFKLKLLQDMKKLIETANVPDRRIGQGHFQLVDASDTVIVPSVWEHTLAELGPTVDLTVYMRLLPELGSPLSPRSSVACLPLNPCRQGGQAAHEGVVSVAHQEGDRINLSAESHKQAARCRVLRASACNKCPRWLLWIAGANRPGCTCHGQRHS